jgi:hypothetical protein
MEVANFGGQTEFDAKAWNNGEAIPALPGLKPSGWYFCPPG